MTEADRQFWLLGVEAARTTKSISHRLMRIDEDVVASITGTHPKEDDYSSLYLYYRDYDPSHKYIVAEATSNKQFAFQVLDVTLGEQAAEGWVDPNFYHMDYQDLIASLHKEWSYTRTTFRARSAEMSIHYDVFLEALRSMVIHSERIIEAMWEGCHTSVDQALVLAWGNCLGDFRVLPVDDAFLLEKYLMQGMASS